MALALTSLYESMVRQFRTVVSDDRFQQDFVSAVNLSLDQLSDFADLTTPMGHIQSYKASISELNPYDLNIIEPVVVFNLVRAGRKHIRGDDAYVRLKEEWENALGDFLVNESKDDQDDVDTDGTGADYAGLGDKTDSDY